MRLVIPAPAEIIQTCPNTGCGVEDTITGIVDHMSVCPMEIVECPCPGCYERMPRVEVTKHVEVSQWKHIRNAVFVEKTNTFEMDAMKAKIQELEDEKICAMRWKCLHTGGPSMIAVDESTYSTSVERSNLDWLALDLAGCKIQPTTRTSIR